MGKHGLHLGGGEVLDQGVEEHDAARAAQSDHGGIGGAALPALVGDPHPQHGHAGLRRDAEQAAAEIGVFQGDQAVEQRHQPHRRDPGEEGVAGEKQHGAPEPPPGRRTQESIHDLRAQQAEHPPDHGGLADVPEPAMKRLVEEPESAG